MKIYAALFYIMLGFAGAKFVDNTVIPMIDHGYNQVDDAKRAHCKARSVKWYRRVTFQSRGFFYRCMADEI